MKINTPRLTLRPIEFEDNQAVFFYRSDAITNRYQGWVPKTLEDTDTWISKRPEKLNQPDSWYQLVIIEKSSDTLIGDIGIYFSKKEPNECLIGFTLNQKFHRKGFATEAVNAVIKYLFNTLKKKQIKAHIDSNNKSSIKLVNRIGFKKENQSQSSDKVCPDWLNEVIYSLSVEEWRELQ